MRTGTERPLLPDLVAELGYCSDWGWAWNSYKSTITHLSSTLGLTRHLEVGGGRDPLFTTSEADRYGLEVTVNDISQAELDLCPSAFRQARFDVGAPLPADYDDRNSFDLVYSRMVMEHVADVAQMWANTYTILRPGGMAIAFFPTLFAPPFVLNRMLSEGISRKLLLAFAPDRADEGNNPKFPALYQYCFGSDRKISPLLDRIGFSEFAVLPFYGYSYFDNMPLLRRADASWTQWVQRRDHRTFTSFAYVIARK